MKAALNPFNPGSGLSPPALVGREAELDALDVVIERVRNGLDSRGIILKRAAWCVGKTVLLNEMRVPRGSYDSVHDDCERRHRR